MGLWLLLLGIAIHAYALIALSVLIAGAGGGTSYPAGVEITNAIASPEHRAEILSAFAVACYLGFSVPVLAIGIAAAQFGLSEAFVALGIFLATLSVFVVISRPKKICGRAKDVAEAGSSSDMKRHYLFCRTTPRSNSKSIKRAALPAALPLSWPPAPTTR